MNFFVITHLQYQNMFEIILDDDAHEDDVQKKITHASTRNNVNAYKNIEIYCEKTLITLN